MYGMVERVVDFLVPNQAHGRFGIMLYKLMSMVTQVLDFVLHTCQLSTLLSIIARFHTLRSSGRFLNRKAQFITYTYS